VGLTLLRPIQPMLAQTATDVADALTLATGVKEGETPRPASVEWKLDGARIQVHRAGDDVRIYTRNLNDVTDRLPGIVDLVRSLPASRLVLDGEAVGVGEDELPRMFQDTMSQFGRQDGAAAGFAGEILNGGAGGVENDQPFRLRDTIRQVGDAEDGVRIPAAGSRASLQADIGLKVWTSQDAHTATATTQTPDRA